MKSVTIYTTPTCPYCAKAKALFDSLSIPYEEIDVVAQSELREQLIDTYNWQTVPAIFIDGQLVGGYDDVAALHAQGELMKKLQS